MELIAKLPLLPIDDRNTASADKNGGFIPARQVMLKKSDFINLSRRSCTQNRSFVNMTPPGKGFSLSHIIRIRRFYLRYPKGATLSHLLSGARWIELLKIDGQLEQTLQAAIQQDDVNE